MNSRMERYNEDDSVISETRTSKNKNLYDTISNGDFSRVQTNSNFKVIETGGNNIDMEKIKKYITSMNQKPAPKREKLFTEIHEEEVKEEKVEPRDYDINSVLEKARQGREINYERDRYKKLHNTQYDILSQLKMYEKKEYEEEELEEFNTDERTLIDLINTVTIHKDDVGLLDELKGDATDEAELVPPMKPDKVKEDLKREIIKEIEEDKKNKELEKTQELKNLKDKEVVNAIDKSFYTNSMTFSKEDFEGFEELEKSVKKNNVLVIISLIVLVISILGTLLVIANYVFNLGLF